MSTLNQLISFLQTERDLFENNHNNLLASSLSHSIRYLEFSDVIRSRVEKASAKFIASHNKSRAIREEEDRKTKTSPRYLTKKEQSQSQKSSRDGRVLQLEIESFYVFAKIYLDKTTHVLEVYFGQIRDCSFESFSRLHSLLDTLENKHGFKIQSELRKIVEKLENEIVEFRDKKIIHAKMPRVSYGLLWNKEGRVSISTGFMFPKPTDKYFQTADVKDLWKLIERYTNLWIDFIILNRGKTKLQRR